MASGRSMGKMAAPVPRLPGWSSLRPLRYCVISAIAGGLAFCQLPLPGRSLRPLRAVAEVETEQEVTDAQLSHLRDLATQGLANEAEDALYEMIDAGVKPESPHFSAIIASCAPNADVDRAERWLFRMKALEVEPTLEVFQELMHVAAEAGNPAAAEQWMNEAWQEGHQPELQSFKYLLRSLRKSSDTVKVETWFERLMQMQLQPDIDCVNEIIGAYVDQENVEKAIEWKAIAKRLGLAPNVETYKLLISTYAKMGLLKEAEDLFEELAREARPSAEIYALLTGDGRSYRHGDTVKKWSQRLLDAKIEIDSATYTAVIGAWASVGNPQRAEEWFERMMKEEKATPEALAFLVDALVLASKKGAKKADKWIEKFENTGQELTAKVYAARAGGDVISGDFEQVEARMQQMEAVGLEIDEDALTVLLLAYGYAKPQQTLLAEQMFKQQMLRGKVRATREVLEALRLAVGGARCLQLRRELQIGTQKKSPNEAIDYAAKSAAGKNMRPRGRSRVWKSFLPPEPPAKRLKWE